MFTIPEQTCVCVYGKHSCSPVKSLFFFTLAGVGLINVYKRHSKCSNLCMQSRSHVHVHREKQMCLTTRGVTVMEPMKSTVCLCAWSTNQNKALTGAQFSCGAASLCAVLPTPAPFSSPFNHCLFTLSQELNEPRLRALPGKRWRPRPALPSVSLSVHAASPPQQPP